MNATIRELVNGVIAGTTTVGEAEARMRDLYKNMGTLKMYFCKMRRAIRDSPLAIHPDAKAKIEERIASLPDGPRKVNLKHFLTLHPLCIKLLCGVNDAEDKAFLQGLTLEPDYLKGLCLTEEEYAELDAAAAANKLKKARHVVKVSWTIVQWARVVLREPGQFPTDHLVVAIAVVTGRRMVEILSTGTFTPADDEDRLIFEGQAKVKLNGDPKPAYTIPVLAPASHILNAHARVKEEYGQVTPAAVNANSPRLNESVRDALGRVEGITFHSLRTFYVLATFEAFRPHTMAINVWGMDVLGHDNMAESTAYLSMEIEGVEYLRGKKSG
jgi:hypothetical protein